MLKGILHFSSSAPTPSVHFLCSELPIEGKLHKDIFSLFYSVWSNPDSKVHKIVKYLLQSSSEHSRTWSNHIKYLSQMYGLEDPSSCLSRDPPDKISYKRHISHKIQSFHEKELRHAAETNSKMRFMNVQLYGLSGRAHPAVTCEIITTNDVKQMRPHLKMLSGDYLTYQTKAQQSGGSPLCRLCRLEDDCLIHIVASCSKLSRNRFFQEYKNLCSFSKNQIDFDKILEDRTTLSQFILDPCSFNLEKRIHIDDPIKGALFKQSREFCFSLDKERRSQLNTLINIQ